jgi:hypothetical protein
VNAGRRRDVGRAMEWRLQLLEEGWCEIESLKAPLRYGSRIRPTSLDPLDLEF